MPPQQLDRLLDFIGNRLGFRFHGRIPLQKGGAGRGR